MKRGEFDERYGEGDDDINFHIGTYQTWINIGLILISVEITYIIMANRAGTSRNGPKSIKAVSRGMGIGITMLANQSVQTTAIPQTPAVCTAAVKWKNKIRDPHRQPILENGDKNSVEDLDEKSKQIWPNMSNKVQTQSAIKNNKQSATTISSSTKESPDAALPDENSSLKKPTTADSNSTAKVSFVSAVVVETDTDTEGIEKTSLQQVAANANELEKDDKDSVVTYAENQLITAIPCMPLPVAVLCLFLNIFVPGTGTIIASFSVFCCARKQQPYASGKKEASVDIMITNLCVGVSQLFTVTFMFIGLIWSITWGVFIVQFAWIQYTKDKEERKRTAAISVANAFMMPGMRS